MLALRQTSSREMARRSPLAECDDDLDNLCEQIPYMLNPYMTAGQVKKEAHISESTLRRAIADGELESVGNAGDHSHFFKKWDVREFIKKRLKRNKN